MKTPKRKAEYYISANVRCYDLGNIPMSFYTVAISEAQALNNFKFKARQKLGLVNYAHVELSNVSIKLTHYL